MYSLNENKLNLDPWEKFDNEDDWDDENDHNEDEDEDQWDDEDECEEEDEDWDGEEEVNLDDDNDEESNSDNSNGGFYSSLRSNLSNLLRSGSSGYPCECPGCQCGDYAGPYASEGVCANCGHYRKNHAYLN